MNADTRRQDQRNLSARSACPFGRQNPGLRWSASQFIVRGLRGFQVVRQTAWSITIRRFDGLIVGEQQVSVRTDSQNFPRLF